MHAVRGAGLGYSLLAYTHAQTKTTDDMYGIFFVRHEVGYFVGGFVHRTAYLRKTLQSY